MHALLNIALRAARDAAEALAHSSDRLDRVKIIDASADTFLTSADRTADKTVLYHLQKAHPQHSIRSRVSGFIEGGNKDVVWLVDPLLGNKNFSIGYTQFAVSVACQVDGVVKHAAIVCPLSHDEFTASRGGGAQLNTRRLRVGKSDVVRDTLISVNSARVEMTDFLHLQQQLIENGASPRISGCTAFDMVQTAADRLQGGWAANEEFSSLAAASLILQEAGGLLGSEAGSPDITSGRELVFGNPRIFKQLLKMRRAKA